MALATKQEQKWPDGFVESILNLLDRIEVEDDISLTGQRFDIAVEHGMTVVFGEPLSGELN